MLLIAHNLPELQSEDWELAHIATDYSTNLLMFYVLEGESALENTFPNLSYYADSDIIAGDWFQNAYPDAPGDTPLEKFLNGVNNVSNPNAPKYSDILGAIALSPTVYAKLIGTTQHNAYSSLLALIITRSDIELFKQLLAGVIAGIPGGLTSEEYDTLDEILISHNFPSLDEV